MAAFMVALKRRKTGGYAARKVIPQDIREDYARAYGIELSPKVGDGVNRKGGISWGCLTPPLLHRRSDMLCLKITSSS